MVARLGNFSSNHQLKSVNCLCPEPKAAYAAIGSTSFSILRVSAFCRDPAFAELRDDPAFKAQLARMKKLINAERAKLKMAPLP